MRYSIRKIIRIYPALWLQMNQCMKVTRYKPSQFMEVCISRYLDKGEPNELDEYLYGVPAFEKKVVPLNFYITDDLAIRLDEYMSKTDKTFSFIARQSILYYLIEYRKLI